MLCCVASRCQAGNPASRCRRSASARILRLTCICCCTPGCRAASRQVAMAVAASMDTRRARRMPLACCRGGGGAACCRCRCRAGGDAAGACVCKRRTAATRRVENRGGRVLLQAHIAAQDAGSTRAPVARTLTSSCRLLIAAVLCLLRGRGGRRGALPKCGGHAAACGGAVLWCRLITAPAGRSTTRACVHRAAAALRLLCDPPLRGHPTPL